MTPEQTHNEAVASHVLDVVLHATDKGMAAGSDEFRSLALGRDGVPHRHTELVPGCFRCDLNRDELGIGWDSDCEPPCSGRCCKPPRAVRFAPAPPDDTDW